MIILPIHKSDEDDTPVEWSLLELNGEIVTPKEEPDGESMELGRVQFDAEGTPIMTIASHELKGRVQSLKQPFIVMKPRKRSIEDDDSQQHSNGQNNISSKRIKLDDDDAEMQVDEKEGYEVAGIVTSKILFDRYPKSIMR